MVPVADAVAIALMVLGPAAGRAYADRHRIAERRAHGRFRQIKSRRLLNHERHVVSAVQAVEKISAAYAVKESVEIPEALGAQERYVVIHAIDHHWQEHLTEMENLRQAVGLRSYGQTDPLVAYKGEAYKYFEELMNNVRLQICTGLFRSASNIDSFEHMLALLSRTARADIGPAVRATKSRRGPLAEVELAAQVQRHLQRQLDGFGGTRTGVAVIDRLAEG